LLIKKLRYGLIFKGHRDTGTVLLDYRDLGDQQRIRGWRYAKTADLGRACIT
jgi:hypothetical protein